jgi:hypothetical protein
MVGCFGMLSDPHASHYPGDRIAENVPRLDVFWLNRIGGLFPGTTTELEWDTVGGPAGSRTINVCRQGPDLMIGGAPVPLAWDTPMEGVDRPWWSCPLCSAAAGSYIFAAARSAVGNVFGSTMRLAIYAARHLASGVWSGSGVA